MLQIIYMIYIINVGISKLVDYKIYNQRAYLFQQLLIVEGLRRSYNDSGL